MMIPGFDLLQEIQRGRRRIVLRAVRQRDGRPVIIKAPPDEFPTPAQLAALRREHQILSSLTLDGTATALELVAYRDRLALVLDDPGGELLKSVVAAGPLPLLTALRLASELAGVVGELHRRGIIHKDLNPHTVMVNPDRTRLTLLDFGIATRLATEQQPPTHPHLLEGTIAYMSPEQTGRMNRDVDYRTDLYSLGATLYEMVTGRLPFEGEDPLELIHAHIARLAEPPLT
jgi:serine/threonine protein kinase